jgi:hypothetical protein
MRIARVAGIVLSGAVVAHAQAPRLTSAQAVLERYQQALGGIDSIKQVQSETARGTFERTGMTGRATFVSQAKPFKSLFTVTRPDGSKVSSGFDGKVSWTITPEGASIDKGTPLESIRRDADLQYALHQPDYFQSLTLVGVEDFEGRPCHHLHGVTHWGKDNNQYYDVETGLLAGYRYQSDDASSTPVTMIFSDYKSFGAHLVATTTVTRTSAQLQTMRLLSVTYEALPDALFDPPAPVRALIKGGFCTSPAVAAGVSTRLFNVSESGRLGRGI